MSLGQGYIDINLGQDREQLARFNALGQTDNYTVLFPQHPCVILSALEVLGFQVVTSCPGVPEDSDSYVWTLKKELPPPPDDLDDSDSS
ncbi:uncharacterized protein LOC122384345 isoform X4 [Amphibalanus amphitrite]|uniref:uncharacterized protein LOC122384345 isoform X4 n=1 Tax=Amphibalanus amphitrite TaxID=1232801 RepID=UPI001C906D2F|nr:uncharacterized protein LOC122384345 isoform X4 [Amphibalanus amphitrite]